ncbi:Protein of unknown function [Pyronema omphalodes CBS 100304]|uniref:Uncharacterized protein n=1 Tax=Pyronema omphalodes (strain CBS 100304) TaxID=1076935 RepID=U4L2T3_PYROM|nr:Protein of unknown function [Pyronema omphalodes CBS 100304]
MRFLLVPLVSLIIDEQTDELQPLSSLLLLLLRFLRHPVCASTSSNPESNPSGFV